MSQIELSKTTKTPAKKWILTGLFAAFFIIISSIILLLYPFASKEKTDYFTGEHPVVFQGSQVANAVMDGDSVYVPFAFLQEHMDNSLIYDEASDSMIITTKSKVVQMPSESLSYYVNEEAVELQFTPIRTDNGEMYVAIDPLMSFYSFDYEVLPETGAIWIQQNGDSITHGTVIDGHKEKLRLRSSGTLQSAYVAEVSADEEVFIEQEQEDYYFVRKADGQAGYMEKSLVQKGETEEIVMAEEPVKHEIPEIEGPIHLTWEAVYTQNPDTANMPAMPGVNVISPTWFELASPDGAIKNLASVSFSEWAQQQGYQVWGLFSNAFDPELTHQAFTSFETRQKIIRQLLHYSQIYKLDGINIDIENVNPEDGPLVTQFMREATPYFHEAGLTVSMDITFIASGNWSAFYEREKLSDIVDYLVVMAYDEHWGTSPVAGSVASFPWVESNLEKLLEIVPNDRLILGVPLYARLWAETENGEVSSQALSMAQVQEWLNEHGVTPEYDPISGQNYAQYYDEAEKTTYKIWLEDSLSLKKRADLAVEYDLAGVASWSRYFADESAWSALAIEEENEEKQ
ncbi:glycosyl hydrolase family 18 protein [Cytobacillus gottheilii]|uniref:glycosyl hydrolase family 18 protein n=1 Tax=Cytobacillus gottheilii TaxID=859144 RepID=UPI0009BBCAA8|nr:glycosyl hydrolase family 18 protein [Cytobacillus gottheilii]